MSKKNSLFYSHLKKIKQNYFLTALFFSLLLSSAVFFLIELSNIIAVTLAPKAPFWLTSLIMTLSVGGLSVFFFKWLNRLISKQLSRWTGIGLMVLTGLPWMIHTLWPHLKEEKSALFPFWMTIGFAFCFFSVISLLSLIAFKWILKNNLIPKLSSTEREALLAGDSWIETEFFTGRPDLKKLLEQPLPMLTEEEKRFLENETEQLCALSDEWKVLKRKKLDAKTEDFLKEKKFFGLIIPKKYEGRGFSPLAHAQVIEKLASHNIPLSTVTMVPNSLGPAELLLNYGTEEQKNKYLPRLAKGEDLPCFGLTEPQAGSDAASIISEGVLFKESGCMKIRLNWNKRWITLSPKATLIGLAVQLKDPDQLYSKEKNLGITCLLVPGNSPGIERGLYHDPMGLPIYNAPIKGKDVIVSAESAIIGGLKLAGKGWKMLMESLSSGRGISMPSLALGCCKRTAWISATHAMVRKQFGLPIGKFEGVEEVLAGIAGQTHLISAVQTYSLSGLNQGAHSSVSTALVKYNLTEIGKEITKKGMDIMGGAGLSLGPRNKIAFPYILMPIASIVEGANILTRTLIIYSQGLIKAHPYIFKMIQALEQNSFKRFHEHFWRLVIQFIFNLIKSLSISATGWLFSAFNFLAPEKKYSMKLIWASSLFAFLSDLSFISLGGGLKRKGKLTGRLADLLSHQYMASALIWHYRATGAGGTTETGLTESGSPKVNEPIGTSAETAGAVGVGSTKPIEALIRTPKQSERSWIATKWGLEYCFAHIQSSLTGVLKNHPSFWIRMILKPWLALLKLNPIGSPPSDSLGKKLAQQILEDEEFRKELCSNMYFPNQPDSHIQRLIHAYKLSLQENKILKKIKEAGKGEMSINSALGQNIISPKEHETLKSAKQAQWEAIQVDAFTKEEYFGR